MLIKTMKYKIRLIIPLSMNIKLQRYMQEIFKIHMSVFYFTPMAKKGSLVCPQTVLIFVCFLFERILKEKGT